VGDALSEGRLVALGTWDGGAKTYGAWELGEGMSIGGGDPYRNFVTIVNTHDGNGTYGLLAPIRLGCTNQTNATFGRKATPRFTIRHVGEARVQAGGGPPHPRPVQALPGGHGRGVRGPPRRSP
jgi:hypothetical protein